MRKHCSEAPTNKQKTLVTKDEKTDKEVVGQLIHGDRFAFTYLYNNYADKVYYFALKYLRSKEAAENLTQEVFVKLWETHERLDPEYSFNAYLFTIARNSIFNSHRKKRNEIAYLNHLNQVFEHAEFKTEQEFHLKELHAHIEQCVDQFPAQRQKVFRMSRTEGFSHKEIASKLGISEKTIAAHIRLALKTLRKFLNENKIYNLAFVFTICNGIIFQ